MLGVIIYYNSIIGLVGSANFSPYSITKFGIIGLTKSVALETALTGITCNAICPSFVKTDMVKEIANKI